MVFEKTKEASSKHTEEEIREEEDLKEEEETSTEIDHLGENEIDSEEETSKKDEGSEESEESLEELKAKLKKIEEEKENYRRGMLSAKARERSLTVEAPVINIQPGSAPKQKDVESVMDINDEKILKVIYKQNERRVLREVIDSTSSNYMPELVDDRQYQEIIGYLPTSIDKSSDETIRRALRIAVNSWKFDRGMTDSKLKEKKPASDLASNSSSSVGSPKGTEQKKQTGRKIIKKTQSMDDWYK